jgi:hypothetical protein
MPWWPRRVPGRLSYADHSGILDASQPGIPCFFARCGYSLKKSLSKRILMKDVSADNIAELEQLRHKVEVCNLAKKMCNVSKSGVRVYLL